MITISRDENEKQFDPFIIDNKQEGYAYRLLNRNERNLQRKLQMGYEIVKDTDPEKLRNNFASPIKRGDDLDSTQQISDLILARIPLAIAEKHRAYVRELNRRRKLDAKTMLAAASQGGIFEEPEGKGRYTGSATEDDYTPGNAQHDADTDDVGPLS